MRTTAGDIAAWDCRPEFISQRGQAELVRPSRRGILAKDGIHLGCLEHLPRTHLDGAALQLADGTPVIGLTLRYDRLDNFWFCLLHELSRCRPPHGRRKWDEPLSTIWPPWRRGPTRSERRRGR